MDNLAHELSFLPVHLKHGHLVFPEGVRHVRPSRDGTEVVWERPTPRPGEGEPLAGHMGFIVDAGSKKIYAYHPSYVSEKAEQSTDDSGVSFQKVSEHAVAARELTRSEFRQFYDVLGSHSREVFSPTESRVHVNRRGTSLKGS